MPINDGDLDNWFTYHDDPSKVHSYEMIRDAAKDLARIIIRHTPPSADQTTAIRKVREAVMTANAAIACGGN